MKTNGDSTDFYTIADDNSNYMYESGKYLDSLNVKQIQKESKGVIIFKAKSGLTFKIKLDTLRWGIILFNGKSKPIVADITNIESDYKNYMQN